MDSDGNTISVLEEILEQKQRKRTFLEKYLWCCFNRPRRLYGGSGGKWRQVEGE